MKSTHASARLLLMPEEIEPSSYQCDCGYVARFSENTVNEVKQRSLTRRQWLSDGDGIEKHIVVRQECKLPAILCAREGRHEERTPAVHVEARAAQVRLKQQRRLRQ